MNDIKDILTYWIKIQKSFSEPFKARVDSCYKKNVSHDFLPIVIRNKGDKFNFCINYNDYLYFDEKNIPINQFHSCYFIEKIKLKMFFLEMPIDYKHTHDTSCSYYSFTERVETSANSLWLYHTDNIQYNFMWLYLLTKQLYENFDNTIFKDTNSKLIKRLLEDEIDYANQNNIELPIYSKQGSLILPKGCMFQSNLIFKNIEVDIINILYFEMQYIKANYQLCVFNDLVAKKAMEEFYKNDKGIGY